MGDFHHTMVSIPMEDDEVRFLSWLAQSFVKENTVVITDTDRLIHRSPSFQSRVRSAGYSLMSITFCGGSHWQSDWVLNTNPRALDLVYAGSGHTRFLLGARFMAIRPEFRDLRCSRTSRSAPEEVLIAFGGADATDQTLLALEGIATCRGFRLRTMIATGPLYQSHDLLRAVLQKLPGLQAVVHNNTPNIASLMARAVFGIVSPGTAFFELCCLGVPALLISTSEREREAAAWLEQHECCIYLGHAGSVSAKQVGDAVDRLLHEPELRKTLTTRVRAMVDGGGVSRIVDALATGFR